MRRPTDLPLLRLLTLVLAVALALAVPATAQEAGVKDADIQETDGHSTLIFQLKHVQTSEISSTLSLLPVNVRVLPDLNSVIVSGPDGQLDLAKSLISALDTPRPASKAIELTVYILEASRIEGGDSGIPERLASVTQTLRDSIGYRSFALLDTLLLRTEAGSQGSVDGGTREVGGMARAYRLSFDRVSLLERENSTSLRFQDLVFETGPLNSGTQLYRASMRTDLEVREGQTVVVGKATPAGTDQAMILIIHARMLDS